MAKTAGIEFSYTRLIIKLMIWIKVDKEKTIKSLRGLVVLQSLMSNG